MCCCAALMCAGGLDYGGLAREWFHLLSREVFHPRQDGAPGGPSSALQLWHV